MPDLVVAEQGHFFTGLREHTGSYGTAVTGMHVQYQIPRPVLHENALVLVHGGGGQALDYLATPDGRPGWATLFALDGYATYVVDRPGMGRSPYHPDLHGAPSPPASYQGFVAGFAAPAPGRTQWPGSGVRGDPALEQFLAGQEPLAGDLASAHEGMRRGAAGLLDRIGRAALVTHSLGGAFGWLAAAARPGLVSAIVAVEPFGPPFAALPGFGELSHGLTAVPLEARFDGLPVAVVTAEASGRAEADHETAAYLKRAGADVTEMRLADLGIHGNGHLMMLERNHAEIAAAICAWLAAHADRAEHSAHEEGLPMREELLDPTGASERAVDTTLAPRLRSLRGLTVGLLENGKPNAATLLSETARELRDKHGVRDSVMYLKGYFGTPVEESLIQKILHNCDFVVAGIGD